MRLCLDGRGLALFLALAGSFTARSQPTRDRVLDQLKVSRARLTEPAAIATRREEVRSAFLKGARLWPPPIKTPLHPVLHSRRELAGYTVENVLLETLPGFFLAGNLYTPNKTEGPRPIVLSPHGHFHPKGRFDDDQQRLCAHLARMGAVVFTYGMVGWNDSTQTTHDDPNVLALQTWNSIRAVDFVTLLPGVDADRIGAAGASGGGTQTLYLAFLDERVKALAPVVIVYPWTDPDGCKCEGGLPVMQAVGANIIELSALCAPRSQCVISVGGDQTAEFPLVGRPFVAEVYRTLSAKDAFTNPHFPAEAHDLGPSKRRALYEFFAKTLGLKLLPEETDSIIIEPPAALAAVDASHPLPPHALHGQEKVATLFARLARLKEEDLASRPWTPAAESDDVVVRAPGALRDGGTERAEGAGTEAFRIVVRDRATGKPTPCRITVSGAAGRYFLPPADDLAPYALAGEWPAGGAWGNREGKGPYRWLGRFFYSRGESTLRLPAGTYRIDVVKGFEFAPVTRTIEVANGHPAFLDVELACDRPMTANGYYSGDPHLHFPRTSDRDEELIFDLLDAEEIRYGAVLAYNEPAGPYAGFMQKMASPQLRGLGAKSERKRGERRILSGQEYRTGYFGHMNLYLRDDLVADGREYHADDGPVYGEVARETRTQGGRAIMAHGGYAQEIYADAALGRIDAVELLQFGVYRGIGRADWYDILASGYRFPMVGASDYPACRWLGDCRTYVWSEKEPGFADWLAGAARGRSFVTTGPLILFEVNGARPGAVIQRSTSAGKDQNVLLHARIRSEVVPVTTLQFVVNGAVVHEVALGRDQPSEWQTFEYSLSNPGPCWIAARLFGLTPGGLPNAEAHTNPVYLNVDGKAPFDQDAIDRWITRIDGQRAVHEKRKLQQKAQTLAYFQEARDALVAIRARGGLRADEDPFSSVPDDAKAEEAFDASRLDLSEEEIKERLKPLPCPSPEESRAAIEMIPGFEVTLAAAEPLVVDPIAASFDELGNLYVCEMRDYPYKPAEGGEPLGTVRLLRDTNGDGVFDQAEIFADKLLWPAGVACWQGGVFVASTPDIWYLKDTDGDLRADVKEKVFTGFGTQNQQAMVNNLVWGMDNKIYGSTAGNGGAITQLRQPGSPPIQLDGFDFRFDPRTGILEPIAGTVQFGTAFDDWGNRFLCDESEPIKQAVWPIHYLDRNPYLPTPPAIVSLAPYPVPIHRISPIERWREIRSSRRVGKGERQSTSAGASHYVIDAAAGLCIYRGSAFPPEFLGQHFVGCSQNNLIHRRTLKTDGILFDSQRADAATEFLRASDNWFRPVNLINTPDGTLLCLDMCREVIESIHIPLDVVKHLDLTSGRDRGRLWRIAPVGHQTTFPALKSEGAIDISLLASPQGWVRDTVQRLIVERPDLKAESAPKVRKLLAECDDPRGRLHALWTLAGLREFDDASLLAALADADAHVREHAVRLAETRLDAQPKILEEVARLVDDPSPRVRMQALFTLGESKSAVAAAALLKSAREPDEDRYLHTALLSSVAPIADQLLTQLLADAAFHQQANGLQIVDPLAVVLGARGTPAAVAQTLNQISRTDLPKGWQQALLLGIVDGRRRAGRSGALAEELPANARDALVTFANRFEAEIGNESQSAPDRAALVPLLSLLPKDRFPLAIGKLLANHQSEEVQTAALLLLQDGRIDDPAPLVLPYYPHFSPKVRTRAAQVLTSRSASAKALLNTVERKEISLTDWDASQRRSFLEHPDPGVRQLAGKVLQVSSSDARQDVIDRYLPVLAGKADGSRGREIYQRACAQCHQLGTLGTAVGPPLTSSVVADPAALLGNILDPNRQVAPNYAQYIAVDTSGRSIVGLLLEQSASSVTILRERSEKEELLRANIEELVATGKSLMPEGIEQTVTPEQMADLIAFLQQSATAADDQRTRDFGTLPGLIEPSP